jgi:hypothetical protein
VVVGSSARSAAAALLQRALLRQLLFDWRLTALSARQLKLEVLRGWSTHVQEAQVRQHDKHNQSPHVSLLDTC